MHFLTRKKDMMKEFLANEERIIDPFAEFTFFEVINGTKYEWFGKIDEICLQDNLESFNETYNIVNSTLASVKNGCCYVTPYMKNVEKALLESGQKRSVDLYVPYANGAVPVEGKEKWEELRKKARETYNK